MLGILRVGFTREELGIELDDGVLEDELRDGGEVAIALITDGSILVVSREEEEGGEATDVVSGINIVLSGIDLGNDDRVDLAEGSSDLLVEGGEGLAVTAPGGVELNQNVLGLILDNLVKVLVDQSLDVLLRVLLREGLRAAESVAGAQKAAVDELDGGLVVKVLLLVESVESGLVILPGGEDQSGKLRSRSTPLRSQVGVGLSGGLQKVEILLSRERVGDATSNLKSIGVIVEEHGHGALGGSNASDEGLVQDESLELGGGLLGKVGRKSLNSDLISVDGGDLVRVEEDNGAKLLLNLLSQLGGSDTTERVLRRDGGLGNLVEGGGILSLGGEQNNTSKSGAIKEGIEGGLIGNGDNRGLGLTLNPLLEASSVTLSGIVEGLSSLPANGEAKRKEQYSKAKTKASVRTKNWKGRDI